MVGHISHNCLGKQVRRIGLSASLLSKPHKKVALPVIVLWINGIRSLALLDISCSQSVVSRLLCHSWKKKEGDVLTVGERSLRYSGVRLIQLDMSNS